MSFQLELWFIYFFLYCVTGRLLENAYVAIYRLLNNIKIDAPLFKIPSIPLVYGFGAIAMTLVVHYLNLQSLPLPFLFLVCAVIGATIEWLSATFLQLVFGKNIWWDYSNRPYNFQGKICLLNTVLFGLGGILVIRFIQPLFIGAISNLHPDQVHDLVTLFIIALIIDNAFAIYKHLKDHNFHRFNYLTKQNKQQKSSSPS